MENLVVTYVFINVLVWVRAVVISLTRFTEPLERDILLLIYLFIY